MTSTEVLNTPPSAMDDSITVSQSGAIDIGTSFAASIFLNNDTDENFDQLSITSAYSLPFTITTTGTLGLVFWISESLPSGGSTVKNIVYSTNSKFDYLASGEIATDIFEYKISDGNGGVDTARVNVTIIGENDAPTDITIDNLSIDENIEGAVIGNITVADVDTTDTHSFTVDDERFEVINGQLKLKEGVSLDREVVEGGFGGSGSLDITITAIDEGGLSYSRDLLLQVNDVNEAPMNIILTNDLSDIGVPFSITFFRAFDVSELEPPFYLDNLPLSEDATEGSAVAMFTVQDESRFQAHTYSLNNDPSGLFNIANNYLYLVGKLDYEAITSHNITVTVTDPEGLSFTKDFTINVTNVDDNDIIEGTEGNDTLSGGVGNDTIQGFAGHDILNGNEGNDLLYGYLGADSLFGETGDDFLSGGYGNDRLFGGEDNDTLNGNVGDDLLFGGDGDDILQGGLGADRYAGGTGEDSFVFEKLTDSTQSNRDVITDFEQGTDVINLAGLSDQGIDGMDDLSFTSNASYTLISATTPGTDFQILLSGVFSLVESDFVFGS